MPENMRIHIGDRVCHPTTERTGEVADIHESYACLMRTLVVKWDDGQVEELEELEFGPLED